MLKHKINWLEFNLDKKADNVHIKKRIRKNLDEINYYKYDRSIELSSYSSNS